MRKAGYIVKTAEETVNGWNFIIFVTEAKNQSTKTSTTKTI
jgi:hypothetical protein